VALNLALYKDAYAYILGSSNTSSAPSPRNGSQLMLERSVITQAMNSILWYIKKHLRYY